MAEDELFLNDVPPKKPKMSATVKLLLWLIGIGAVLSMLCCGVVGFGVYKIGQSVTEDPVKVREGTAAMLDIKIPDYFTPTRYANMVFMQLAQYDHEHDPGKALTLMQFSGMVVQDPEKQREEMLKAIREQQAKQGQQQVDVKDMETREIEIQGKKVPFQFGHVEDHGAKHWQVMGVVPGKGGSVMIVVAVPEEDFGEDQIVEMLQSIQ